MAWRFQFGKILFLGNYYCKGKQCRIWNDDDSALGGSHLVTPGPGEGPSVFPWVHHPALKGQALAMLRELMGARGRAPPPWAPMSKGREHAKLRAPTKCFRTE